MPEGVLHDDRAIQRSLADMSGDVGGKSLGTMLDERVNLRIRISLMENQQPLPDRAIADYRGQLVAMELLIDAKRRALR